MTGAMFTGRMMDGNRNVSKGRSRSSYTMITIVGTKNRAEIKGYFRRKRNVTIHGRFLKFLASFGTGFSAHPALTASMVLNSV